MMMMMMTITLDCKGHRRVSAPAPAVSMQGAPSPISTSASHFTTNLPYQVVPAPPVPAVSCIANAQGRLERQHS